MAKINNIDVPRTKTEQELARFLSNNGKSGLVYFRGRRRVGKTTLLNKVKAISPNIFYFIGVSDETNKDTLSRFAKLWDDFTGKAVLRRFKKSELDWSLCFEQINNYALANSNKTVGIIFDEIQWIAKNKSGLVGTIKDKWIDWERANNIKLIICGSSNKFFVDQTGGEEKILRGLKTHSDIILPPLTASEIREYYYPDWSVEEVLMLCMMIGGIPYYLNQITRGEGFIRAVNGALFTKTTIFLSEVDEILNLEFNRAGIKTIKKILGSLGIQGGTFSQIVEKMKMSQAGVFEAVNKLLDYSLLKEKALYTKKDRKKIITQYFFDDPYLLFYFSCLEKMKVNIEENDKELLICNLISSDKSLYIANFTGRGFEIYIRNLLTSASSDYQKALLELAGIPDRDFEFYDSLSTENAGDFVLVHRKLRTHFVLECKWTQSLEVVKEGIEQVLRYNPLEKSVRVERVVITNYLVGSRMIENSLKKGVRVICMGQLFK